MNDPKVQKFVDALASSYAKNRTAIKTELASRLNKSPEGRLRARVLELEKQLAILDKQTSEAVKREQELIAQIRQLETKIRNTKCE